jgi:ABC-type bacteriocin/lantibiotic exporter with double-glycine peptidase domain
MAHVNEARDRAKKMAPEVFAEVPDPDLTELLDAFKKLTKLRRRFTGEWWERRRLELTLITKYSTLQKQIGQAAGRALDKLTTQWLEEAEPPRRRLRCEAPDELRSRALERFVCLVYVSYLLVVLVRIRSLIMAIGGVYILVLLSVTSYPFQPRATIQALAGLVLLFVIAVVTTVFAQMHKNNTLSHITNTTPGELGTDFWIRTTSFVALPLFSFFASQFPQVNRFLYSWLEPALKALNK